MKYKSFIHQIYSAIFALLVLSVHAFASDSTVTLRSTPSDRPVRPLRTVTAAREEALEKAKNEALAAAGRELFNAAYSNTSHASSYESTYEVTNNNQPQSASSNTYRRSYNPSRTAPAEELPTEYGPNFSHTPGTSNPGPRVPIGTYTGGSPYGFRSGISGSNPGFGFDSRSGTIPGIGLNGMDPMATVYGLDDSYFRSLNLLSSLAGISVRDLGRYFDPYTLQWRGSQRPTVDTVASPGGPIPNIHLGFGNRYQQMNPYNWIFFNSTIPLAPILSNPNPNISANDKASLIWSAAVVSRVFGQKTINPSIDCTLNGVLAYNNHVRANGGSIVPPAIGSIPLF